MSFFIFQFQLIVNGQTGLSGDHVLKAVVVEPKNLQDPKLCWKVMVELVQAQVKNLGLVIANPVLVRFYLPMYIIRMLEMMDTITNDN